MAYDQSGFIALFTGRLLKVLIMFPINTALLAVLIPVVVKIEKKQISL